MQSSRLVLAALIGLTALAAETARAAPPLAGAEAIFHDAKAISLRDAGRLWGIPLYGPMLIVDPDDRTVIANQSDSEGVLKPSGDVYVGALPGAALVSDTPIVWSGKRWTELMWPLQPKSVAAVPPGIDWRSVMLAHEMFHRIQPTLGLSRPEVANVQLDTLQGRYLLQLEWRALARALTAPKAAARRAAVADALLFHAERDGLFPGAAARENALEIDEGTAEYTGVKLGLTTPGARTHYAVYDLSAFLSAPSFVRAFPYASGPAYGLLLDGADPLWRGKLNSGRRVDQLLAAAFRLPPPDFAALKGREAAYDPGGTLHAAEVVRAAARRARDRALEAALIDGPVLRIPLHHIAYSFKPQTLEALPGHGVVYPTLRLTGEWGVLQVDSGGALMNTAMTWATVSAARIDPSRLAGPGWTLTLNKGWVVRPGARKGDLVVTPEGAGPG